MTNPNHDEAGNEHERAPNRRQLLIGAAATVSMATMPAVARSADTRRLAEPFRYCLNTSTIRGQQLGILEEAKLAAKIGYSAIEPWISQLDEFRKQGGALDDLGKQIRDLGLTVESAIGFAKWIVDDDEVRRKGLEQARRDMEMLRQIGGVRIAAPPVGAHNGPVVDLNRAAERYRDLLKIGAQIGVVPQVEIWGFSSSLSRIGEAMYVALECGHPNACLLADVYHIYRGGSDFTGLGLLRPSALQVLHINDYPAHLPRTEIKDADRVYPGDGVAPLGDILRSLREGGGQTILSLELFNPRYWKQNAEQVLKTGLEKMREAVEQALT